MSMTKLALLAHNHGCTSSSSINSNFSFLNKICSSSYSLTYKIRCTRVNMAFIYTFIDLWTNQSSNQWISSLSTNQTIMQAMLALSSNVPITQWINVRHTINHTVNQLQIHEINKSRIINVSTCIKASWKALQSCNANANTILQHTNHLINQSIHQ